MIIHLQSADMACTLEASADCELQASGRASATFRQILREADSHRPGAGVAAMQRECAGCSKNQTPCPQAGLLAGRCRSRLGLDCQLGNQADRGTTDRRGYRRLQQPACDIFQSQSSYSRRTIPPDLASYRLPKETGRLYGLRVVVIRCDEGDRYSATLFAYPWCVMCASKRRQSTL